MKKYSIVQFISIASIAAIAFNLPTFANSRSIDTQIHISQRSDFENNTVRSLLISQDANSTQNE